MRMASPPQFRIWRRGVRETLEEAILYLTLIKLAGEPQYGWEFNQTVAKIRKRASGLVFPKLLAEVKHAGITAACRLRCGISYRFRERVNCLEHRAGVVGTQDLDPGDTVLNLRFPRIKFFYVRKGVEIELYPSHRVDAQDGHTHVDILARANGASV